MILMGDGSTEERHEAIAQELINGPFVPMHLVECYLKKAIEERVHCLRSDALSNRSRVRQVTEQHRHLFAFTFESTPGGQNFFGKVFGGIGQWFSFGRSRWRSCGFWGERRGR